MNTTVEERGCQTDDLLDNCLPDSNETVKENGRCEIPIEVHAHQNVNDYCTIANRNGLTASEELDEDEYVLILKKPSNPSMDTKTKKRLEDSTSKTATGNYNKWRPITKGEESKQKTNVLMRNRTYERNKGKNFHQQNGARSSSGNWSATTSELVQSSSTSSSPLHMPNTTSTNTVIQHRQTSPNNSAMKNAEQQTNPPGQNEEAESVYSVDNDGYYTSMHTDSGLHFGTIPLASNINRQLLKNQDLTIKKRNLIEKKRLSTNREVCTEAKTLPNKWRQRVNENAKCELLNNLANENAKVDNEEPSMEEQMYSSNLSINSILSNSDAATSTAMDADPVFDTASSMVDFDCSVSHCSHINSLNNSRIDSKITGRIRTASGTYDDDDDDTLRSTSSSSTRHACEDDKYDLKLRSKQKLLRNKIEQVKMSRNGQQSAQTISANGSMQRHIRLHRSLTESSSNSSSCRKLPPPPPPPRVSSMLRTLKKYADDAADRQIKDNKPNHCSEQDDNMTVSSFAMSERSNRTYSDVSSIQHHLAQSESETNSEYFHSQNERRRRLFLEIDSSRSYPPLSYIGPYDQQTDTDTSIRVASSTCYEEDELDDVTRTTDDRYNTGSSTSRTITPVSLDANEPSDSFDERSKTRNQSNMHLSLEERHLSSPLPPPKLDSFPLTSNRQNRRSNEKDSPPTKTSSADKSNEPPKPKPRNSLHLATPPTLAEMEAAFNNSNSSGKGESIQKAIPQNAESVESQSKSNNFDASPESNTSTIRRLTTEDLFIILHNSKKKHNIRTEPTIFTSNRVSPSSSSSTSPRTPPKSITTTSDISPPTPPSLKTIPYHQTVSSSPPSNLNVQDNLLKRRSWTGMGNSIKNTCANGANEPRTRQSLALDRLGPIRPTTLNDFKRLLAQVRSSPTSPTSPKANPTNNSHSASTYSALQQVLKSSPSSSTTTNTTTTVSSSSSSGISSSSSISSPLSPISPISSSSMSTPHSSPEHKKLKPTQQGIRANTLPTSTLKSGPNGNQTTMSNFIKKFSKSKFLSNNYSSLDRSRSAVSRLVVCPPIPEDDDSVNSGVSECLSKRADQSDITSTINQSSHNGDWSRANTGIQPTPASPKHNCTSTWV